MAEMTEVAKGVATHQRLVALLTQENRALSCGEP